MLRQLLAATLCAVLVAPAYPSESTLPRSSSTPSHSYDAATLSKTRVWGSNEKILLHFRATLLLSEKQHWGCTNRSDKTVVGSVVTYDYDAFGNLLHQTGTTLNNYLYAGEQFDPDLNLYYNRARYLNVSTGRFWNMDTYEGDAFAPISLHKYLYASSDPVNRIDPEGQEDADVSSNLISASGQTILATIAIVSAVAAVCTIDYELGRDDCFDRNPDRERTFHHGTTLLDAQEVVQNQAFNVVRKIARQKNPSILDFGSGLYMTDSLQTAGIFAGVQGFDVREGGPAVVRVDITQRNWKLLVLQGAIDSSPITGLGGHSQVFVPFFLVPRLDYLKQNYSLISPPFD